MAPVKPSSIALGIAGALLLGLAAALVPRPLPGPRPDLPEIPPFAPGERIALVLPAAGDFPPPAGFGLVQRARAAGAEVRVFVPNEPLGDYAPSRIYQPAPWPDLPAGYHPDRWPALPPGERNSGKPWQMLVLSEEEMAVKNAAVLAAAHALRAGGADTPQGAREANVLARARRAELVLPMLP